MLPDNCFRFLRVLQIEGSCYCEADEQGEFENRYQQLKEHGDRG